MILTYTSFIQKIQIGKMLARYILEHKKIVFLSSSFNVSALNEALSIIQIFYKTQGQVKKQLEYDFFSIVTRIINLIGYTITCFEKLMLSLIRPFLRHTHNLHMLLKILLPLRA